MRTLKKLNLLILSILLLTFYGCNNDSKDTLNQDGPARISIKLVDSPGDYDQVFVEIVDIMIKMNDDSEGEGGWESTGATGGDYDLLTLTGGQSAILVDNYEVLDGELSQIRLVLGDDNYVIKDGERADLKTPSAQQSGLKIKVNQTVEAGYLYSFVLDFDVAKSIVDAGNSGNIILKPVIYASLEAESGIIQGIVSPSDFPSEVSVMVDGETISTFATPENEGAFMIYGVFGGTYNLTVTPEEGSGYASKVISVDVENGQVTDVGTIELELLPGSITGKILNDGVAVVASVMIDAVEVTANTDDMGVFLLENIPVGTYTVILTPADGFGLSIKNIENVEVTADSTTDLGEITLE